MEKFNITTTDGVLGALNYIANDLGEALFEDIDVITVDQYAKHIISKGVMTEAQYAEIKEDEPDLELSMLIDECLLMKEDYGVKTPDEVYIHVSEILTNNPEAVLTLLENVNSFYTGLMDFKLENNILELQLN